MTEFPGFAELNTALLEFLPRSRWFRSKARPLLGAYVEAWTEMPGGSILAVVIANFSDGGFEYYALPIAAYRPDPSAGIPDSAWYCPREDGLWLGDGSFDPGFRAGLLQISARKIIPELGDGHLVGNMSGNLPSLENFNSILIGAEQSNTAFAYSTGHFLKLYRLLEEGIHPEPEILRFLRDHTGFRRVPEFVSSLDWVRPGFHPVTVGVLQNFVSSDGNAWEFALKNLPACAPQGALTPTLEHWAEILGQRTAELHRALGSRPEIMEFAPEGFSSSDHSSLREGASNLVEFALETLHTALPNLSEETATLARQVLGLRKRLLSSAFPENAGGMKFRIHGDLHLGQILCGAGDIWFLDFEGETQRPMALRRTKQSPLKDVAGMLRSFHYAVHYAARSGTLASSDPEVLYRQLCGTFLAAYHLYMEGSPLLPGESRFNQALEFFILEKAVYELLYDLNNRPDWVEIPLRGLLALSR